MSTYGIHHITAISSSAQKIYDFYTGILGLRMIKRTVNFDAPEVYHLYFGNEKGEPGTIITFFPFEDAGNGMRGLGQVTKIYFAVPKESIGYWIERLITKGVRHEKSRNRFNETYITFYDPDGLQLEIVGTKDKLPVEPYVPADVPKEHAIRSFYGVELAVESEESIAELLTEVMGYRRQKKDKFHVRYVNDHADYAKYLDLFLMAGWPEGISSAGIVHHIAFRVKDQQQQTEIREKVMELGFSATDIIDRNYFTSVYFREHNNILFEIATDGPGFLIDETLEELGSTLKLPRRYEQQREVIERSLPDLYTGKPVEINEDNGLVLFNHRFIDNGKHETVVLFHGTGGNEKDMIQFAAAIGIETNILSIRGNTKEHGMNRFFVRNADGSFDEESIRFEVAKFDKFLNAAVKEYKISEPDITFLGYSNGANFALAYTFLYPTDVKRIFALHPVAPLKTATTDLKAMKFVITYGENEEYATSEQVKNITAIIETAGGKVETYQFNGGHEISDTEIELLRDNFSQKQPKTIKT